MRVARFALVMTLVTWFSRSFQPYVNQPLVDSLWLLAIAIWVFEIRQISGAPLLHFQVARQHLWPIIVLIAVFAASWLPFYDNWRWAYTGDSLGEFSGPIGFVDHPQNILSIHGIDDTITWLHILTYNVWMFVFRPTFFWHRFGKLTISCLALAAIYAYFTLVLNRWWAAAVALCVATNYVWLWFSHVSYEFVDSYIFYYSTLSLAYLIVRRPTRLGLWMACGVLGGLSLFYSQPAWSAVAAVGLFLATFAAKTRRLLAMEIYTFSFLLVGLPIFLQGIPGARAAKVIYDWHYLTSIFIQVLRLPYASGFKHIGVLGGFLRWPLDELYVVGVVVAALAAVPAIRRTLRLPVIAPVMLALLVWDAALLSLTNNGYGAPSSKRSYNLIPLQIFFGLLPLYVVHTWAAGQRWLHRSAAAVTATAICVYAAGSLAVTVSPTPGLDGSNSFDGFIELRQRFPDRAVVFLSSRQGYRAALVPKSFFDTAYHLLDQLTIESDFSKTTIDHVCQTNSIVCTEPDYEREQFDPLLQKYPAALRPFPILNSHTLRCYQCNAG